VKQYYIFLVFILLCLMFTSYKALFWMDAYMQAKLDDARHQQIADECIKRLNEVENDR